MLKLVDLIDCSGIELGTFKIHCASNDKDSDWRPLEAYRAGNFDWGQARQTHPNFECANIVSLFNLGKGDNLDDLKEHLRDLYEMFSAEDIPGISLCRPR